jgi:hypothetical protein
MALCSLSQLKARLGIADTRDDAALAALILAVSDSIQNYCGRVFAAGSGARTYTAAAAGRVFIDDAGAVSEVATDDDHDGTHETIWDAADYALYPLNAAYGVPPGPYWEIRTTWPTSAPRVFPPWPGGVRVTAAWGFGAEVPAPVQEACLDQCVLQFRARSAPHGVTGSVELDTEIRTPGLGTGIHPFVRGVLDSYKIVTIG